MTITTTNSRSRGLTGAQVRQALPGAIRKLDPRSQWHNPVMFLVWAGAALTTIVAVLELLTGNVGVSTGFSTVIAVWLWLTVIFANLAESIAEGRGKARADAFRATRSDVKAKLLLDPSRRDLFEMEDVKLGFTDDALVTVAKKAIERKTGARGLSSIMEQTLSDLMFDLPSRDDVARVLVTRDLVEGYGVAELYPERSSEGKRSA